MFFLHRRKAAQAFGGRKAQVERDLSTLIESAEELQEEHNNALSDISEAEKIRARLQSEPLAQALLDHDHSFKALGPVMERLEHAKDLGFTVTLLDRAVERGLAVIHQTVEGSKDTKISIVTGSNGITRAPST